MSKHIYGCIVLVLLLSFCITGCNNKKQGQTGHVNDISFDSIQVEKEYYLLGKTDNPHCELKVNFIYPQKSTSPEILEAVRKDFITSMFNEHFDGLTPVEALEKFTDEYLKEYKSLEEPFREDISTNPDAPVEAWYNYTELRYNEIYYNRSNILSYSSYRESFTGGAHGSHLLKNRVLDLSTGKPITEEDIFIEGYQDRLAEILRWRIAAENEVPNPKDLEDIGYFSTDEIYPNNNFLIDSSGITYDFNEYEIAAYVVGITSIQLTFQEIRPLLLQESPISHLFN